MKSIIRIITVLLIAVSLHGQSDRAAMDIVADDKGIFIPRIARTVMDTMNLNSTHNGLMVFNKTDSSFYYWNSTMWQHLNTPWIKNYSGYYLPVNSSASIGTDFSNGPGGLTVEGRSLLKAGIDIGAYATIYADENTQGYENGDTCYAGDMTFSAAKISLEEGASFVPKIQIQAQGRLPFDEFDLGDPDPEITLFNRDGSEGFEFDFFDGNSRFEMNDQFGNLRLDFQSDGFGNTSGISLYNNTNRRTVSILGKASGNGGQMTFYDGSGFIRAIVAGNDFNSGTSGGTIMLLDGNGGLGVTIKGNYDGTGDGRVITEELEITGGSDIAEMFVVNHDAVAIKPGTIVSIDPNNIGQLKVSEQAYDKKIIGVISGANGIESGMMMGQKGSIADGNHAVSLIGRVYVRASATNGPIKPGDVLTSSNIPGVAMKATKKRKSRGATIGKAMTTLDNGEGMVLIVLNI